MIRHRTDDAAGQKNGRPLTIDNDRADMLKLWWQRSDPHPPPYDLDAFRRADQDPFDPLYDPMEQRGDVEYR